MFVITILTLYLAAAFFAAGLLSSYPSLMYTQKNTQTHTHMRVRHVTHLCLIHRSKMLH